MKEEKRTVAWNAHQTNDTGVIWCMVTEDEAGYRPMLGNGPYAAPWYLAQLDDHRDEDGNVDYKALWENAERTVNAYNESIGISREEAMNIVASSMRAGVVQ